MKKVFFRLLRIMGLIVIGAVEIIILSSALNFAIKGVIL